MSAKKTPVTKEELQEAMEQALASAGWTPEEVSRYVAAQRGHGWLRESVTEESRHMALMYYVIPPASGY